MRFPRELGRAAGGVRSPGLHPDKQLYSAAGMEIVGKLYDDQEYFVPEMLLCADALYAGLDILKPHIRPARRVSPSGAARRPGP